MVLEEKETTLLDIVNSRTDAEQDYKTSKLALAIEKANFWDNVDWKQINENRGDKPKITNDKGRLAYAKLLFENKEKELLLKEVSYHHMDFLVKSILMENKE